MFDSKKTGVASTNTKDREDKVVLTIQDNDQNTGQGYSNVAFESDESIKNDLMQNRFGEGNDKMYLRELYDHSYYFIQKI